MNPTTLRCVLAACLLSALAASESVTRIAAQSGSAITINGAQLNQVMDGFGVNINVNAWNGGELIPALDRLVDEMGSTLFRVYIDNTDWEAVNDNADPNVFNWTYYTGVYTTPRMEELWSTLAYLNQKGISSGIVLNFMGPVSAWMGGGSINTASEDEWVEMVASVVYYARVTRGLQFTRLAPLNEPNWDCKEGPCVDQFQTPRLLQKLAQRLDGLGLTDIKLVGPETAAGSINGNTYIGELLANPVVMSHLDLFAYHSYAGDSAGTDALIRGSAYPTRRWWISEQMLGDATQFDWVGFLMTHLRDGASATLAFKGYDQQDNHHLAGEDLTKGLLAYNATTRTYAPRRSFYGMTQVAKFVGPGARRIGSTSPAATPVVAFYDSARSRLTIVGYTSSFSGGGTFTGSLAGLPTVSRLQYYRTDNFTASMLRDTDVVVTNGTFSLSVPGATVFTLTATLAVDAAPPAVSVTAPQAGATVSGAISLGANASDDVGVAGVQFLVNGVAVGAEDLAAPYTATWNSPSVTDGQHTVAARARDGSGKTTTSAGVVVTVDNTDTTLPTVAITSPPSGSTVSGTVTLSANASDDGSVSGVRFFVDGAPLGPEDTTAPYSAAWSTVGLEGPHTLSAQARDGAGNIGTSAGVPVTVTADPTGPTVAVTEPTPGATVSGTVRLRATASDNVSVLGVQFFVNGVAVGAEDTTSSYRIDWNTTTTGNGSRTVTARARDADGNQTTSAGITVTVSNAGADGTAPAVSMTAPAAGATVSATVTLSATASDNVGVAGVQFLVDGAAVGAEDTTAPYSVSWASTTVANGAHTVSARARDAAGNQTVSAGRSITVSNASADQTAPNVSVTSPTAGATLSATVTLSATASDNVGVAGVQFLVDGAAVGAEDTSTPYSTSWTTTGATNGTHQVSARARDGAGNVTTSAVVTATVSNAAPPPSNGLVAAYGFNEGAGVSAGDRSGRGHTATISGAAWTSAGRFGAALSFDGVNDLATVADTAALDLTAGMTLEAWVRPTANASFRTVVLKEAPAGLAYALYSSDDTSRPAGHVLLGGNERSVSGNAALTVNTWTHLAVTYDGTTIRVYVNGVQAATESRTGSMTASASPLRIGGNGVGAEWFSGLIDEVRIYNRALSAAEITSDMNTPIGQ